MKRKIMLSVILIMIIFLSIVLIYPQPENEIVKNETNIKKVNSLSIMIEEQVGSGKYNEANDFPQENYVLNKNLSKCLNGSKINYENGSLTIKGTKTDYCYAYFDYDALGSLCRNQTMAECFIKNYQKDETLYYHNAELEGGAQDESYRYAGADEEVKNFVCLDGNITMEGKCDNSEADLYRIIGLFKNEDKNSENYGKYEMKLIKYDFVTSAQLGENGAYKNLYSADRAYSSFGSYYKGTEGTYNTIGEYYWTSKSNEINEWVDSELRKTNLNGYYLNTYLKENKKIDIDKLIETHTWSLNGHSDCYVKPKTMYDNEMSKVESSPDVPTQTKEVQDKIGLIYVSDYGYAASLSSVNNWSDKLSNYKDYTSNNWMYRGMYEWTISRHSTNTYNSFFVHVTGDVYASKVSDIANVVRPCFYITSSAKIQSGDGSKTNPYRIGVE